MLLFSTKFPSEIAAALGLATSTPLTEGSRKTQRALYMKCNYLQQIRENNPKP